MIRESVQDFLQRWRPSDSPTERLASFAAGGEERIIASDKRRQGAEGKWAMTIIVLAGIVAALAHDWFTLSTIVVAAAVGSATFWSAKKSCVRQQKDAKSFVAHESETLFLTAAWLHAARVLQFRVSSIVKISRYAALAALERIYSALGLAHLALTARLLPVPAALR